MFDPVLIIPTTPLTRREFELAMASIKSYAPELRVVSIKMEGPHGMAINAALQQTAAQDLILGQDDMILQPDTFARLREDVEQLFRSIGRDKLGFVGARSNFAKGQQNIRSRTPEDGFRRTIRFDSEDSIVATNFIAPVFTYVPREALEQIGGFAPIHWCGDDLACYDMARNGRVHFVSRAYVHHVGEVASKAYGKSRSDMAAEAMAWLREHRPDALKAWGWK